MSYYCQLEEACVRTVTLDMPLSSQATLTYLFALVKVTDAGTVAWFGTVWNATEERPVVLENDSTRYLVASEESAYEWWEKTTKAATS